MRRLRPIALSVAATLTALQAFASCHDPALCDDGRCDDLRDASSDARAASDAARPDADLGVAPDTGADAVAGPLVIAVSRKFTTLNDASFTTTEAGTEITGFAASATHPVIVPLPQPDVPSSDYTVVATLLVPADGEFGVLTRMEDGGGCVLFGSKYATPSPPYQPFLSTMAPPSWSPGTPSSGGGDYTINPGKHYKFKVVAAGQMISAKLWETTATEPAAFSTFLSTTLTGRGIGFYSYGTTPTVVEDMVVTVP